MTPRLTGLSLTPFKQPLFFGWPARLPQSPPSLMLHRLLLLGLLAAPAAAQSGSLSTNFGGPMSGGQVMYFDLVATNDLTITSLDVRIQDGNPGTSIRVFRRDGTSLNNEGTMVGWSQVSTGTIPSPNNVSSLSTVDLATPIPLLTGRHGIMIEYIGDVPRYSDGLFPLGRLAASNADLEIYEGSAGNTPFSGRCCAPRVWSGTVFYDLGATGPIGTNYCAARPNSTGQQADLVGLGTTSVSANDVVLVGENLPTNQFGLLITSRNQGFTFNPGGSQGDLCLDMPIGRFNSLITNSGPGGQFIFNVDITRLPQGSSNVAAMPGETWNFQAWYRDVNPNPTSNFTNGLEITFQ